MRLPLALLVLALALHAPARAFAPPRAGLPAARVIAMEHPQLALRRMAGATTAAVLRALRPRERSQAAAFLPLRVRRIVAAGDRIARMPYRYGGGHGSWRDSGYDCSGSVSFALHGAGLLSVALSSGDLMGWGLPGPGRWVTVYANPGHAYMVVAGRRFDTTGREATGSRWQADLRSPGGYAVRHPPGL